MAAKSPRSNDADAAFYARKWKSDKSREALEGFYKAFEQSPALRSREAVIALLGEPSDMDEHWIHYEVDGDPYMISFAYHADSGEITGWTESGD